MTLEVVPLLGVPALRPGDDLAGVLLAAARRAGRVPARGDVLVVCQKAISKVEGRVVVLAEVEPSALARTFAREHGKDPRVVEVVLRESRRVVRMDRGVLLCETHHGLVCANAGVDTSNPVRRGTVTLLPLDPDRSAAALRRRLRALGAGPPAVLVTDTFGRPWREGQVDVAIGVAGLAPLRSFAGRKDWRGRELAVTAPAVADMLAAAAGLVMEKDRGVPGALVVGFRYAPTARGRARELVRDPERDLFR